MYLSLKSYFRYVDELAVYKNIWVNLTELFPKWWLWGQMSGGHWGKFNQWFILPSNVYMKLSQIFGF